MIGSESCLTDLDSSGRHAFRMVVPTLCKRKERVISLPNQEVQYEGREAKTMARPGPRKHLNTITIQGRHPLELIVPLELLRIEIT